MEAAQTAVPTTAPQLLALLKIPFGRVDGLRNFFANENLDNALNVYQSGSRGWEKKILLFLLLIRCLVFGTHQESSDW